MKIFDFTNGKRGRLLGTVPYDHAGAVMHGEAVGRYQRVPSLHRQSWVRPEPVRPVTFDTDAICFSICDMGGVFRWYYLADDVKAISLQTS